jgi:hypothetical protein
MRKNAHSYVSVLYHLRMNSDFRHILHKLIGFYNKRFQRGTGWVFK